MCDLNVIKHNSFHFISFHLSTQYSIEETLSQSVGSNQTIKPERQAGKTARKAKNQRKMGKRIKIAVDATPQVGAGICVIYEEGETTLFTSYVKPHSYGSDPATFEMKNAINALKEFKRYFEKGTIVDIYCDNPTIESEDHPDTLILKRQIEQLEDRWDCDIGVGHETIGDGNLYIEAANELSRRRKQQCEEILMKQLGAKPVRRK